MKIVRSVGGIGFALSILALTTGCPKQNPATQPSEQSVLTDPLPSTGKLVVPAGIAVDTLKVITNAGEAAVGADGAYSAQVISNEPSLVPVVDASDRLILLGFITPSTANDQQLDSKSTAVALLYFAMGGTLIPQDLLKDFITTIGSSPATDTLAAAIQSALAADPAALQNGDPAIKTALDAAVQQITGNSPTSKSIRANAARSIASADITRDDDVPFLNISPSTIQSGIILTRTNAGDGVIASNSYARPAIVYALQVGYDDATGNHVDLPLPEQVAGPFPIIGASSITPHTSVNDLVANGPAETRWTPATTDNILLPLRAGSSKTFYKIIAIGPALDQASPAPALTNADYITFRDEWNAQIEKLRTQLFVFQFMLPIAESSSVGIRVTLFPELQALLSLSFGSGDSTPLFNLQQVIVPELQGAGITLNTVKSYQDAIGVILDRAAHNAAFRDNLINTLLATYNAQTQQKVNRDFMVGNLRRLADAGSIQQAIMDSARFPDLARLLNSLTHCSEAAEWNIDIARVRITPPSATLTKDNPAATFTAQVVGGGSGFKYTWSNTGQIGNISSALGDQGSSFTTTESSVQYIAPPTSIHDGLLDKITVDVVDAQGNFVGSAGAIANGAQKDDQSPCADFDDTPFNTSDLITLTIDQTRVAPGSQINATVTYDWSNPHAESFVNYVYYSISCSNVCSSCSNRGCQCSGDEYKRVLVDGVPPSSTFGGPFESGPETLAINPNGSVPGIGLLCYVQYPGEFTKPEGGGKSSQKVTFTIHETTPPCPSDNPNCSCPAEFRLPNTQLYWKGLFVTATANGGSAARAFQMTVGDPNSTNCP